MQSNTRWVWIALILFTIIGLQFYALYQLPQSHKKELQAVQMEKETLEKQSTQLESELKQLKEQFKTVEQNYRETLDELKEAKTTLEKAQTQVEKLEQDLEKSKIEIQHLKQAKREEEEKNKRLERQLQSRMEKRQVQIASRSRTNETKATLAPSSNQAPSKVMTGFVVTWYNLSGITASGRPTQDGVTIAVDPSVIPLGTWVKLYFPDGTVLKRRADDVGGSIKGRKIDIYKNASTSHLLSLGRVSGVKVEILD